VVKNEIEFGFFVSVALIKLLRDRADPQFVAFALESPFVLKQVELLGAGAGLKHMVLKSIKALVVPLPNLDEQNRIAAQLSKQMAEAERVHKTLEDQLYTSNKLPAAILRRAFSGEL
jgi:type I restriction enzyme, S subunit